MKETEGESFSTSVVPPGTYAELSSRKPSQRGPAHQTTMTILLSTKFHRQRLRDGVRENRNTQNENQHIGPVN